jgi:crotonobetainyl-CoA:carnitine CoA-transferase CaiB-like acyl-CoA transferase
VGEEFAAAESRPARAGNADDGYFVQSCLRSRDGWVAASILGGQAPLVAELIGEDDFTEAGLTRWCAGKMASAAAASLQAIGVAAAPVLNGAEVREGQGLLWNEALASLGSRTPVKGFPFSYGHTPLTIYRDAPGIGEHTARVLTRIVDYTPEQLRTLAMEGAIEVAE